ncbi:MAG: threonylcarbamoyl-AMP synthase [Deltaproteobacteria bacterium RIFCSPHIGHO2_02_FULL_40_11]|nr:MAG: threonylcarbamoyl-AMP synthase [Deltaproteobacteria bacterium RIFCSPHIGHO2_02_FULL_40_11]
MSTNFEPVIQALESGGIIAYPTETVYGLGCDPFQRTSIEKIFELKQRPLAQTPLILIPDVGWLEKLCKNIDPLTAKLVDHFWPGPLTLIFQASKEMPPWLIRDDETLAVRHSSHPWVEVFMKAYQKPLISTSANLSGQEPSLTIESVKQVFGDKVDLYIDGGELRQNKSSSIVMIQEGKLKVLRPGGVSVNEINQVLYGERSSF